MEQRNGLDFTIRNKLDMVLVKGIIKKNLIHEAESIAGSLRSSLFGKAYREKKRIEHIFDPASILYIEDYKLKATYPDRYGSEFNVEYVDIPECWWAKLKIGQMIGLDRGVRIFEVIDSRIHYTLYFLNKGLNANLEVIHSREAVKGVIFDIIEKGILFTGNYHFEDKITELIRSSYSPDFDIDGSKAFINEVLQEGAKSDRFANAAAVCGLKDLNLVQNHSEILDRLFNHVHKGNQKGSVITLDKCKNQAKSIEDMPWRWVRL